MKISWSSIRDASMRAFKNYLDSAHRNGVTGAIYNEYRASSFRAPLSTTDRARVESQLMSEFQLEIDKIQKGTKIDFPTIQIRDFAGKIAYSRPENRRKIEQGEQAECIIINGMPGEIAGRLQIVVKPQYTGMVLVHSLFEIVKNVSIVNHWKVMNPVMGSTGPDSAVLYLLRSIEDGQVLTLIGLIRSKFENALDENCKTPLGLTKLYKGIFGLDLPSEKIQREYLGMHEVGTAGGVIAHIISKGAYDAAKIFFSHDDTKTIAIDNILKSCIERVLTDIGWGFTEGASPTFPSISTSSSSSSGLATFPASSSSSSGLTTFPTSSSSSPGIATSSTSSSSTSVTTSSAMVL
jgi:hypothetical protein